MKEKKNMHYRQLALTFALLLPCVFAQAEAKEKVFPKSNATLPPGAGVFILDCRSLSS